VQGAPLLGANAQSSNRPCHGLALYSNKLIISSQLRDITLAFSEVQRGSRWISYPDLEPKLKELLSDFGPPRKSFHPEYPFSRLRSDGFWEFENEKAIKNRVTAAGDIPVTALRESHVRAGFKEPFFTILRRRPDLVNSAASHTPRAQLPRVDASHNP